jgi:hypothetical protein
MSLESNIKDVISKKLEDGTVEKLIEEQLEKGVKNALENLFRSYGDVTKIIEDKVKSVMIPYLESYDYSDYIVKLDSVLVDVLKSSALENKNLLHNFKELMIVNEKEKEIKVSDLFETWKKYVAANISTDDLEINYDDGISYKYVDVGFEVEKNEDRSWSSFEHATLVFECDKDEEMNFAIRLSHYKNGSDEGWSVHYDNKYDISSLRHLNEFELLLTKLVQNHTKLIIDEAYGNDEILPDAEPEASFS